MGNRQKIIYSVPISQDAKNNTPISKKKLFLCLIAATVVLCLALGLGLGLGLRGSDDSDKGFFRNGAVVANGIECAQIGIDILKQSGNAADAAIATLFCEGVTCPQSMGLGGGFLLTIYKKETGDVQTLVARETAAAAATQDMFDGNQTIMQTGGLSVAVPGELRGYQALYKNYGSLPWNQLVEPTIKLCRTGHIVSPYLARMLAGQRTHIQQEESLREIFINPETNDVWKEGDRIKRLKLADTLDIIAKEGPDALYNGSLTTKFINDIKKFNGIITEEDMLNYKVKWEKPVKVSLPDNLNLYTSPLPGSGILLGYIMNILNGFVQDSSIKSVTETQRVVESFKFAYARRTELGDPEYVDIERLIANLTSAQYAEATRQFISDDITSNNVSYYGAETAMPEDHGTAHISILAPNGDAIAVTSTINYILGAKIRSMSTGIILNDQMDDFSAPNISNVYGIPPSPSNYIVPGKRPMSSMCPTIIVDKAGNARLIIGAAGGTKITTVIAYVTMRYLWYNESLTTAVNAKRIHHQLYPMTLSYEKGFDQEVIAGLKKIGHVTEETPPESGFAALTAIAQEDGKIYAAVDPRRNGSIAGY